MSANVFYNAAGWLAIASVAAIIWYLGVRRGLAAQFRRDFQDALDDGRGPPNSPA
jgi:hypothetical protein